MSGICGEKTRGQERNWIWKGVEVKRGMSREDVSGEEGWR